MSRGSLQGYSVRVISVTTAVNARNWRLDVLYGVKTVDARLATRFGLVTARVCTKAAGGARMPRRCRIIFFRRWFLARIEPASSRHGHGIEALDPISRARTLDADLG